MVEISRTLMVEPKVLLIDEPTAGLSKMLAQEVYEMLTMLTTQENLSILIVNQEIRQPSRLPTMFMSLNLDATSLKIHLQNSLTLNKRSGLVLNSE